MTTLAQYERARAALAEATKPDQILPIRDEVEHLKLYARQIKDRALLAEAHAFQLRVERKLGVVIIAAKEAGQIAEGRRRKADENCTSEEQFPRVTLEEVGIDRKLSARSQKAAGIAEQAFEAMVEATRNRILSGRAKVIDADTINGARAIMGSRVEPDDSLDYFPTPPWATRALIERALPELPTSYRALAISSVWEPACGEGHIAEVLREYFRFVSYSDIHDYGYGTVQDFFDQPDGAADWIITNPPFGDKAEAFTLRALELAKVGVAMFVRQQWLEGGNRYETIFLPHPPAMIAQFSERVPLCKGRWDPKGSTATAYVWVIWLKKHHGDTKFFWLPPDCKEVLTKPDDAERFTTQPVTKRARTSDGTPIEHDADGVIEEPADPPPPPDDIDLEACMPAKLRRIPARRTA